MGVLAMWLLYAAFGVTIFSLVFVWAVRTRQFSDQERARHLALQSPSDGDDLPKAGKQDGAPSPPEGGEPDASV